MPKQARGACSKNLGPHISVIMTSNLGRAVSNWSKGGEPIDCNDRQVQEAIEELENQKVHK